MIPTRVLHVSQPTEAGVAAVLLSYLSVPDPELVHVVACPGGSDLARHVARLGHEHVAWKATRTPGPQIISETLSLRRIVRKVAPDLVHLHSSKAGLAGRLAVLGSLPTVFQPHAWSFSAVDGLTGSLSLQWERAAQRWTQATVCVGEDERQRGRSAGVLRADRPPRNGHVLPNSIDPNEWPVTDRATARHDLKLPADTPLVVCVGRLCEQKGQDLLLEAWPQVSLRLSQTSSTVDAATAQLVLVGDGPARASLEQSAPAGVRMVGSQDPQPWYAAADIVVVPSRWEAMAMVPLEAQASARFVVASDVDGMGERLHPDQMLVPPGRPDDLADALVRALSDLPATSETGRRARQLTEDQWLPQERHRQLREIYVAAIKTSLYRKRFGGDNPPT